MSLWTPGGERPVRRDPPAAEPAAPTGGERSFADELADLSPEDRARAEQMMAEMAEVQQRIAEAPAADVLANHLMGFYELAAIHLNQQPPNFAEAALAIDALRAVLERVGDRLGENGPVLSQALANLQMAFVQLKEQGGQSGESAG